MVVDFKDEMMMMMMMMMCSEICDHLFSKTYVNGFIGIKTNWYTKVKNTYMCPSN